ncbi:glycosyltransferase family 4 protein [bacterium]|nr:glycosyltransferase family 4 protein [bacterium]
MRIALIARGCRPGAGIELYTYELARRLAERHDVHVLTNPQEAADCNAKIVPIKVPSRPRWFSVYSFSQAAGWAARQGRYDIVHTQGSDGTWGDVVTAHSCHLAGMRASLRLHPGMENQLRKGLSPAHRTIVSLERVVFSGTRQLIAISRRVGKQVRAAYPMTRRISCQVIYPGVRAKYFEPGLVVRRDELRKQLGISREKIVLVLVANSPRLKGAERLIRALARVRNRKIDLLIVSGKDCQTSLVPLAGKLGVSERVRFLDAGADVLSAYIAGDIYTALPEYEAFGLAMLEAMACALPLIITKHAGAAELIKSGQSGLLLPVLADDKTVTRALDQLADNFDLRQRMGQAARLVARQYSWDRMAQDIESVYERVNAGKRGEPVR